jgi:hypothetical protein
MREWIETGKVEVSEQPNTGNAAGGQTAPQTRADRPTVHVGGGVMVSEKQMEAFREFGGTMKRTPSRRQAARAASAEPVP